MDLVFCNIHFWLLSEEWTAGRLGQVWGHRSLHKIQASKDGADPEWWQQRWNSTSAGSTGSLSSSGPSLVSSFMWEKSTAH